MNYLTPKKLQKEDIVFYVDHVTEDDVLVLKLMHEGLNLHSNRATATPKRGRKIQVPSSLLKTPDTVVDKPVNLISSTPSRRGPGRPPKLVDENGNLVKRRRRSRKVKTPGKITTSPVHAELVDVGKCFGVVEPAPRINIGCENVIYSLSGTECAVTFSRASPVMSTYESRPMTNFLDVYKLGPLVTVEMIEEYSTLFGPLPEMFLL